MRGSEIATLLMDAVQPNHIALLRHRAKYSGNTVLLKIPIVTESEVPQTWNTITVADFAAHVDRVANFLLTELNDRDIPPRSPVSLLWVTFLSSLLLTGNMQERWVTISRSCIRDRACKSVLHPPHVSHVNSSRSYLWAHGKGWIQNDFVQSLFGTSDGGLSISQDDFECHRV